MIFTFNIAMGDIDAIKALEHQARSLIPRYIKNISNPEVRAKLRHFKPDMVMSFDNYIGALGCTRPGELRSVETVIDERTAAEQFRMVAALCVQDVSSLCACNSDVDASTFLSLTSPEDMTTAVLSCSFDPAKFDEYLSQDGALSEDEEVPVAVRTRATRARSARQAGAAAQEDVEAEDDDAEQTAAIQRRNEKLQLRADKTFVGFLLCHLALQMAQLAAEMSIRFRTLKQQQTTSPQGSDADRSVAAARAPADAKNILPNAILEHIDTVSPLLVAVQSMACFTGVQHALAVLREIIVKMPALQKPVTAVLAESWVELADLKKAFAEAVVEEGRKSNLFDMRSRILWSFAFDIPIHQQAHLLTVAVEFFFPCFTKNELISLLTLQMTCQDNITSHVVNEILKKRSCSEPTEGIIGHPTELVAALAEPTNSSGPVPVSSVHVGNLVVGYPHSPFAKTPRMQRVSADWISATAAATPVTGQKEGSRDARPANNGSSSNASSAARPPAAKTNTVLSQSGTKSSAPATSSNANKDAST